MSDEPITDSAPVPMRPSRGPNAPAPPEAVVRAVHASLRATEAYVRVLVDRIEMSRTSDLVRLDGVPADALVRLAAISDALQDGADRVLHQLDVRLAQKMRDIADLEHQGASSDPAR